MLNHPFRKAAATTAAFVLTSASFLSCLPSNPNERLSRSWGAPMPLRLGVDSSEVHVDDYLEPGESFVSPRYSDAPAEWTETSHGQEPFMLSAPAGNGLGVLQLKTSQSIKHVPILSKGEQRHEFVFRAKAHPDAVKTVEIVGDLNGWTPVAVDENPETPGVYIHRTSLRPGNHPYQWVINGQWMLDPDNPLTVSNGMGGQNSVVRIEPQSAPQLKARLVDEKLMVSTDGPCELLVLVDDQLAHHGNHDQAVHLPVLLHDFPLGRHVVRAWAARGGSISQDLMIPTNGNVPLRSTDELNRGDWHAATMYFLMVDRFFNGNPKNDAPVNHPDIHPKANHQGGDLEGVLTQLHQGYFEDLGMNTIWISPIATNAGGAWGLWQDSARTNVKSRFSSYHGYWPIRNTAVDPRFGSKAALKQLTDLAHDQDMNVLLDYVANHVHQDHPLLLEHPDWTTDLMLPDGSMNTERWDEHRLTTWFDTFMPTLDLERDEVAEAMADSAAWWSTHSGIDGFRHDATKHIPETFWRKLNKKLKESHQTTGHRLFQIGETYGNPDLVGSYLSSGMLDAQFDFNLYDKAIGAIAVNENSWEDLVATNLESIRTYGAHHLMGNITGNQDRPRFTSLADGALDLKENMKFQGWTREIEHQGEQGFGKMRVLLAYIMSIPGIPCVYYGDEIADVGGNDPDNRRMMRFTDLNDQEMTTKAWLSSWSKFRTNHMSMLFGSTGFDILSEDVLRIRREYLGEEIHVLLNRSGQPISIGSWSISPDTILAGQLESTNMLPAYGAVAYTPSQP